MMMNMKMLWRYGFLLLLPVLFCTGNAYAEWTPLVRSFTPNEYKAGTQNWHLTEQINGWIYAANNYGVMEFDGIRWRLYGIGNSTVVRSVARDPSGRIYAGGTDDFGYFTYNSSGGMDYHSLVDSLPVQYRNFGEVWQIFSDSDCLYVQTRNYLFLYHTSRRVQVIDPADVIKTSVLTHGEFYMATSRDVFVLTGNRLHPLRGTHLLHGATVCAMLPWDDHSVLIATDFAGLFVYDGRSIRPLRTDADAYIRDNQLYAVAIEGDVMALGTVRKGLVLLDRDGHNAQYFTRDNGLQNNTVLSLLFDKKSNLWVGLDQGIDCIERARNIEQLNNKRVDFGSGYSACAYGGALYLGTNQGLYVYRDSDPYAADNPRLVAGSQGQVWDVREIDGRLFCSHNRGLFEVGNGVMRPLYTGDGVWSVRGWQDGKIVAGTYNGFLLLDGDRPRLLSGFHETALYYEADASGNLWVLTSSGVEKLCVDAKSSSVSGELVIPYPAAHLRFSLDRVGDSVYLSHRDYFCVIDRDGVLHRVGPETVGLPATLQYPVVRRSRTGRLVYLTADDMPSFMIGGFANLSFDEKDRAVIGGITGFRRISRTDIQGSSVLPELYIRRLRTTSPKMETIYGESVFSQRDSEEPCPIVLPSGTYSLKLELGCNDPLPDNPLFSTRLSPMEQEYSEWSSLPERDFTALGPGDYRIDVRMQTCYGTVERSVYVTILRPWYATWYAIAVYCLLGAGAAFYTGLSIRRRVLRSRRRLLDEKNRELQAQQVRILQLENEKAQFSLRQKSQELSTMLLSETARKEMTSDILCDIRRSLDALNNGRVEEARARMTALQTHLNRNADATVDWQRFEDNYDIVNDKFINRLKQHFPTMTKQERRLAVYIHMGLTSKEIAPMMNMTQRGVDMMRYRMREKMGLPTHANLKQFFSELENNSSRE